MLGLCRNHIVHFHNNIHVSVHHIADNHEVAVMNISSCFLCLLLFVKSPLYIGHLNFVWSASVDQGCIETNVPSVTSIPCPTFAHIFFSFFFEHTITYEVDLRSDSRSHLKFVHISYSLNFI